MSAQPHSTHYRPDIDGLRAIAVVAVVLHHALPEKFEGGFVGVDIFFIISGYLISSIILAGLNKGKFSFADFYAKRVKRIFPALALVLITTLAMGWFLLGPPTTNNWANTSSRAAPSLPTSPSGAKPATSMPIRSTSPCCTFGRWPSKSSSICCGR